MTVIDISSRLADDASRERIERIIAEHGAAVLARLDHELTSTGGAPVDLVGLMVDLDGPFGPDVSNVAPEVVYEARAKSEQHGCLPVVSAVAKREAVEAILSALGASARERIDAIPVSCSPIIVLAREGWFIGPRAKEAEPAPDVRDVTSRIDRILHEKKAELCAHLDDAIASGGSPADFAGVLVDLDGPYATEVIQGAPEIGQAVREKATRDGCLPVIGKVIPTAELGPVLDRIGSDARALVAEIPAWSSPILVLSNGWFVAPRPIAHPVARA